MENIKEWSENIKNNLSIEQIKDLLSSFGGDPILKNNILISRTICHGGHSHKLYYYENTKLFKCYTDCNGDAFDVFELIMKMKKNDGIEYQLPQAINFIINYFGLNISQNSFYLANDELEDWKILNQYEKNEDEKEEERIIDLTFYDDKVLKFLPKPHILPWELEGITKEVMDIYGICYDPVYQGVVIPHYDINNNLIGIRERTLIKENENNGKYKPAILNYKMYNHPLGFSIYNLNNSKDNIKIMKKVILFEGEKSCLKYASFFGIKNDLSGAVCGSNLTNYQVDILLSLGVEEIIIAFDRQFKEIGDEEWKIWTEKLNNLHNKYGAKVQISYMFDKWNLLGYKDSPIDRGPEVFLELFNKRVHI